MICKIWNFVICIKNVIVSVDNYDFISFIGIGFNDGIVYGFVYFMG